MAQSATTKTNMSAPVAPVPPNDGPDCDRVNTVLDQLIDGHAVTEADEDYLYDHATDCSPCFEDLDKQRVFINFLNQRVSRRPIPASLHQSILARVGAEVV
ncbi:hypothetical protein MON38_15240 [Hymenobacter sp. DH14]|uniref:Zinc-finger domain-containing protein n=1 Tax=Hymenobacter cyanobacteriorum TaxID=2926463 RepID=A0A9X2AG22_9BACT|nr:hypothetical protein [Hymenobacter cyanobacteriorum]MCI1188781.1 hypothetical protein [Hymenobacter cyanobacteriorum]